MADCQKIRRVDKRVCIGALNKKIVVNTRTLTAPSGSSVDFTEEFTEPISTWANIVTRSGTVVFDGTNTAREISHDIYIRYRLNMTPEKWVKLPSINGAADVYLDIIQVENLNEENKFYRLRCALRGDVAKPVNFS